TLAYAALLSQVPTVPLYNVEGLPSRNRRPCPLICRKAVDNVVTNTIYDDETKPSHYQPAGSLLIPAIPDSEDNNVEITPKID
ncbi:hypothetical protein BG005_003550, partial [Podila minutissima]